MPHVTYKGKKTAVIRFMAQVDGETAKVLLETVDRLVSERAERLILLMSTPGGSVFHGLSVYNYLRGLSIEIETVNFGSVDSIGVVIFCAGSRRTSVPNARFLLHGVSSNIQGPVTADEKQLEEIIKGLQIDVRNISRVVAETTKKTEQEIYDAMINRTTLDPQQAMDFGLVTGIETGLVPAGAAVISIQK